MKSVDVPGRMVRWRPDGVHEYLSGEVLKVWYEMGADPRYPKGSRGYKNGIRALFRKMKVETGDGRVFRLSAEHEDLKAINMIAESGGDD